MSGRDILLPVLVQVLLTIVVGLLMFIRRVGEMRERRIPAQALATSAQMATALSDTRAADNFRNLFEVPVLFFAAVAVIHAADLASPALVALAWAFVATRVVHSAIHCGYNRVVHRFAAFVLGYWIVTAMWALIARDVFFGGRG